MAITINGTTGIAGVDGSAGTPAVQGTDTNTGVFFGTDTVTISTGGTAAVTVDSGQRTKFPTTIGVGGATPSTSGSGISFPATASASSDANTLDDYEEGTFTPTMTFATPGSSSFGYAAQLGKYTKIGNTVVAWYKVALNSFSKGTASGDPRILGLPFAVSSGGAVSDGMFGPINLYNAPFSSQPTTSLDNGETRISLKRLQSNNVWTSLDDPDSNSEYFGYVVYAAT
jgi:hypothetical protein